MFGQIKEGRGLRRFLLRGLEKVDGEWHLIAATHNLLKLFRHRRPQQQAQWQPPDEGRWPRQRQPGLNRPPSNGTTSRRANLQRSS